jgi:hypothetical protein
VKALAPHVWSRAGASISSWSEKLTEEAKDRRVNRRPQIVQVEREYTRYSTSPNSLDRMIEDVDWSDPDSVIHRTDPILTSTRETAKRVRKQYRHLGGRSKLQDPGNVDSATLSRFVRGNRAG